MLFLDCETVGLTGPIILIQWAIDDGPVKIHDVFDHPIQETLDLMEWFCEHEVCCWNLPFDWFHINKMYNLLRHCSDLSELAQKERELVEENLHAQYCLKPTGALDLLLYAKEGPLQKLMIPAREANAGIKIKRVPLKVADRLVRLLPRMEWVYAKKGWQKENISGEFCDITQRFAPTLKLKQVIKYLFDAKIIDYPVPDYLLPRKAPKGVFDSDHYEYRWKPWGGPWPSLLNNNIHFWKTNATARRYAEDDVKHLQRLWNYWERPNGSGLNSKLAVAVACARWRGVSLDLDLLEQRIEEARKIARRIPFSNSSAKCKEYILGGNPGFSEYFLQNTREETLQEFIDNDGIEENQRQRAGEVIAARHAVKRMQVLNKLRVAKRFFPSFNVIGTKSNRMSGEGGLNPQGIQRSPEIRSIFTFADSGFQLSGGDYSSFEVTIADAVYGDNRLHAELIEGKNFFGLLGEFLHGHYLEKSDPEYQATKNAGYAWMYGAHEDKMAKTAGVSPEIVTKAIKKLLEKYSGIRESQKETEKKFASITQPGGIGTQVVYSEPAEYAESLLGFRRYYSLENFLIKELFELAESLPEDWDDGSVVVRRKREQTVVGATRSALYSTVFQIQSRNLRSAKNHYIQSVGAEICKNLQADLWSLQPQGVHPWHILVFNVHDEVLCVHDVPVKHVVDQHLSWAREKIPLAGLEWKTNLKNWSEK